MKKTYEIDLTGVDTYGEFHNRISDALSFPEYYGNNLDALYDCLTDMDRPTIEIHNLDAEIEESYVKKVLRIMDIAHVHIEIV